MVPVFHSLPSVIDKVDRNGDLNRALVFSAWRRAAGPEIGKRTLPVRFANSILTVAVENRMWQRQLKQLGGSIVFKVNSMLGSLAVDFLEFEIDPNAITPIEKRPVDEGREQRLENALASLPANVVMAATSIADPGLRKVFLKAAGCCLSRGYRT